MKLIIASDIHGSLKYTKKLEELIINFKPDKIILLGDILYHGARNFLPDEYSTIDVTYILNKYAEKIIAVRGNCDSEIDNAVTNFDLTSDYQELIVDGIKMYLTHGHLINKYNHIFENNYLLSGHTHVYNLEGKNINPGSVGLPRINKEHTCIIYENKVMKLIDLENFQVLKEILINEK